jgi:tetratricopeptide (TPR) repeat protein
LNFYYQIALQKISGTKIQDILDQAKAYYENRNFSAARTEYQKALSINPNLTFAKDGLTQATKALSEKELLMGITQKNLGRVFEAIQLFEMSLKTYPQNSLAKSELESIRKLESYRIDSLKQNGIVDYQKRNYDRSIDNFQKILLLNPSDKSAAEYLRLSKIKREAIQKIEKRQSELRE